MRYSALLRKISLHFLGLNLFISPNYAFANETLTIGTDINRISLAICERIFAELSKTIPEVTFKVQGLPNKRSLIEANAGEIDGDCGRVHNIKDISKLTLSNLITIPESIIETTYVLIRKKESPAILSLEELKNRKVAITHGVLYLEAATKNMDQVFVKKTTKGLQLVQKERVLGFIASLWQVWRPLKGKNKHLYEDLELSVAPIPSSTLHTMLHKKHRHLIAPLGRAIKEMKESGKMKEISESLGIKIPMN